MPKKPSPGDVRNAPVVKELNALHSNGLQQGAQHLSSFFSSKVTQVTLKTAPTTFPNPMVQAWMVTSKQS